MRQRKNGVAAENTFEKWIKELCLSVLTHLKKIGVFAYPDNI
jgi:hypothetical protein